VTPAPPTKATLTAASTQEHYAAFGEIVREYSQWLSHQHAADAWFIEAVLKHQSLEAELRALPAIYGPPGGAVLLVDVGGKLAGAVALRTISDGVCEMKRMFVRDGFRGRGIGRLLAGAAIAAAREKGFGLIQLDTSRRLTNAISLYVSCGFRVCEPYRAYPPELQPHVLFMEMHLTARA
jgi:GNAT superfamily N-acetyltransferase